MAKSIIVNLEYEKATKNTVKFAEKPENEFVPEKLGTLYVPKATLAEIGYKGGNITAEISTDAKTGVVLTAEKPTKNTVKFNEESVSEFVPEKIGSVYVPKVTLAEIGWKPEQKISVRIAIAK